MSEVAVAVVTGFVSALTTLLAVVTFTGRQIREVREDIHEFRTGLKGDVHRLDGSIYRLDGKLDRLTFELMRHISEGGHQPPPQAA